MSPTIDPSKLKVTELREQLQARGLDVKGNKPVLVKRLKKALEEELNKELPDTSIADTSTEDLDSSQNEEQDNSVSERKESVDSRVSDQSEEHNEKEETHEPGDSQDEEMTCKVENIGDSEKTNGEAEHANDQENKDVEMAEDQNQSDEKSKGEKRKHSSPAPESPPKKVRSVIQEDEPEIDSEKVLLSWYDSDLYLKVDKKSFLSAQPFHDNIFGYAWAGVRATHGVQTGKVRYEVKITEELKWEDYSNNIMKRERERQKQNLQKAKEAAKKAKEQEKAKAKENKQSEEEKPANEENTELKTEDEIKKENFEENEEETTNPEEEQQHVVKKEPIEVKEEKMESEEQEQEKTEEVDVPEVVPYLTHIFRAGWSLSGTSLQLGEDEHSYGYESTGKFAMNKEFTQFGDPYKLGDVVGAYLNITDEALELRFTINGELQPHVKVISRSSLPEDAALFPHILTRNFAFELNLGGKEEPWFATPEDLADYVFLEEVENKIPGPARPANRNDCEVLLVCGLPASGKTHWVKEYLKSNADKQITVLGLTQLLDRMTFDGEPLKSKYLGQWHTLMDRLQKCLNKLIDVAPTRRRNYIIEEQMNLFPSAQRRKLRSFEGFKRKAVLMVVSDEEQSKRQALKEEADGKSQVNEQEILEMKANIAIPQKNEYLDEVIFAGLNEEEATKQIAEYNKQGRAAGFYPGRPTMKQANRRFQRRNDYRSNNYPNRNYSRYGPRAPSRGGSWNHRPSGGGWSRERRDNRPNRDWIRNSRVPHRPPVNNRNVRNNRPVSSSTVGNRNHSPRGPSGGRSGNWQPSGNWVSSNSSGTGAWTSQSGSWGTGNQFPQGQWGAQGQWNSAAAANSQWQKYGGNQQGYNWNYYGQYGQNWGSQGYNNTDRGTS